MLRTQHLSEARASIGERVSAPLPDATFAAVVA
jgi:hypothetical protein